MRDSAERDCPRRWASAPQTHPRPVAKPGLQQRKHVRAVRELLIRKLQRHITEAALKDVVDRLGNVIALLERA